MSNAGFASGVSTPVLAAQLLGVAFGRHFADGYLIIERLIGNLRCRWPPQLRRVGSPLRLFRYPDEVLDPDSRLSDRRQP